LSLFVSKTEMYTFEYSYKKFSARNVKEQEH
jgi:hypothetical protein